MPPVAAPTQLKEMRCRRVPGKDESACCVRRKRALLLFLHNTKQRLLRLLIVVKWANKVLTPPSWNVHSAAVLPFPALTDYLTTPLHMENAHAYCPSVVTYAGLARHACIAIPTDDCDQYVCRRGWWQRWGVSWMWLRGRQMPAGMQQTSWPICMASWRTLACLPTMCPLPLRSCRQACFLHLTLVPLYCQQFPVQNCSAAYLSGGLMFSRSSRHTSVQWNTNL